jgi:hypothetical protein
VKIQRQTFDNWQQGRYENFSRHCKTIRATRWIGTKIREHPVYDGTSYLRIFLIDLEDKVVAEKRIPVLDIALKSSPARWWATHKGALTSWDEVKLTIQYRFYPSIIGQPVSKDQKLKHQMLTLKSYDGSSDPKEHVVHCIKVWKVAQLPSQFWVHQFIHSLGQIPNAWYVHEETRRQTACWEVLQSQFYHDFSFSGKSPEITLVLQQIKKMLFTDEFKPTHPPIVYPEHEYLLHHSLYPSPI